MADKDKREALKKRIQTANSKVRASRGISLGEVRDHILEIHAILDEIVDNLG